MMKPQLAAGALIGVLLLLAAGCIVPSLHALYTEKDLVFDPALVGTWKEQDGDDTAEFTKADETSYKLVLKDNEGKTGAFSVHLAKIHGKLFLDLYPIDLELPKNNDFYRIHYVPTHSFLWVRQITPSLKFSVINFDWLGKHLAEHPEAIQHERIEDNLVVLTAPTASLQEFVTKLTGTADAFSEPSTYWKVTRLEKEPAAK